MGSRSFTLTNRLATCLTTKRHTTRSRLLTTTTTAATFSTRYLDQQNHIDEEDPSTSSPRQGPVAAYVHLPFCKKKCLYCDFPVIAVGMRPDTPQTTDNMQAYIDLLLKEIALTPKLNVSAPLQSVFFGGGTPSLIPPAMLERLITTLDKTYGIALGAEISIEADPGTFNASQLRSYKSLGVSRVSIGVQSFDDHLLTLCGRAHNVNDAYKAIEAVYAADMPSWSLDLMSGLPELTPEIWAKSLAATIDAQPNHVSVYDLQVEENTPFAKMYRPGKSPLPSDETAAEMFKNASSVLGVAGYEHYELSNYAKKGHRCRHNMVYWEGLQGFYAFGMGAASYLDGRRFSRPKRIGGYREWVEQFEKEQEAYVSSTLAVNNKNNKKSSSSSSEEEVLDNRKIPGSELPRESPEDVLLDTIMLRLRLKDGLDVAALKMKVLDGADAVDIILTAVEEHVERGLVEIERDEKTREVKLIRLTDPEGLLLSNDVISDIFAALDITSTEL